MLSESDRQRFFSKLKLEPVTGCLEWQGSKGDGGYGQFHIGRHPYRAHRVAAYLAGLIPNIRAANGSKGDDLVLHACDNPICCGAGHLFVGTHQDNMDDARVKGRTAAQLSNDEVLEMRELYATTTFSINRLAFKFRCDPKVAKDLLFGVYRVSAGGPIAKELQRAPIPKPDGKRIITFEQAEEVRLLVGAGIHSQTAMAREMDVSQRLISDIMLNKRYRKP